MVGERVKIFDSYFYHQRIRNSVAVFGRLFNSIYIVRNDAAGNPISSVKVPLSYAPKRKYLERLLENPDFEEDNKVAIKLPRMSFEIVSFSYDPTRQLTKTNNINRVGASNDSRVKFYTPTPYNINFQLNVYCKTQDDALQVVEQIIPYFAPQYTLTVKPLANFPDIKEDVPISIQSISFSDDYEGQMESRRTIIYTLDFEMKINFYGPASDSKVIKTTEVGVYDMGAGLNDSDVLIETIRVQPNPLNASADSDYGFITTIFSALDSA